MAVLDWFRRPALENISDTVSAARRCSWARLPVATVLENPADGVGVCLDHD